MPQFCFIHRGKPMCHFAPGWPPAMQTKPTKTFSPREMREDPVVQPPTLKEPVTIQRPTNSHGPYVRREGGNGRVSLLT
ncbi:ncs1 nucleoside transporter [Colletotrichum asianum]